MTQDNAIITLNKVQSLIYTVRGEQVMLDSDLAEIYGVETKMFNQAVKRNIERFPELFRFQLTQDEYDNLRSQSVTSSHGGRRSRHLPEIERPGLTRRRGMNRKTVHGYPQAFAGSPGQVRASVVVVEATSLGSFETYNQRPISTYLAEMMREQNQEELIAQYGLDSFPVNALRPERTLCEKIMSLVRFSYSEQPLEDLKLKIRHTAQMNHRVREMIAEALQAEGVEEIFKLGEDGATEIDLFDEDYLAKIEKASFEEMGINIEEKAFYDILKELAHKYDFEYPEDKLLALAKEVKQVVDDKAKYTDWDKKADIKAELKVDLILLLAKHDYPPVNRDEVYKEIFEQAENFKKYQGA